MGRLRFVRYSAAVVSVALSAGCSGSDSGMGGRANQDLKSVADATGHANSVAGEYEDGVLPKTSFTYRLRPAFAMTKSYGIVRTITVGTDEYTYGTSLDKPWGKTTLKEPADAGVADPALHAKIMASSKDVHLVGKEPIGNATTTHYAGTVKFAPWDGRSTVQLSPNDSEAMLRVYSPVKAVPFDIWVDGQKRVRKLVVKGDNTFTLTISAYDVPTTIKAPPPDQVDASK